MRKGLLLGFLILTFIISIQTPVQAQEEYTPTDLALTVYADGVVRVEYDVEPEITYPIVDIMLFGTVYEDLIVEDQDGILLDYSTIEGGVEVYTLGASSARITYLTSDLTSKSARTWVLTISTPINSHIILPQEATIISLNHVPLSITTLVDQTVLIMPKGEQQITYIIGIVGTREHALILINDVVAKIQEIKAANISVTEAEAKLQEAREALNLGQHTEAEQLARQAKELAIQTEAMAKEASSHISGGESSIIKAQQEGRTTGLDEAQIILQQAKNNYTEGNYEKAIELAERAKIEAEKATTPEKKPYIWILGITAIAVIIAFLSIKLLKKPKKAINVEEIFRQNPQLRYDDREVIQFIAERGGESLETDIRERFRLPRTTAWRLVKRLQREGIIETQKVGGQNLIKIKKQCQE